MAAASGIRGRFFSTLIRKALEHYERHKATIDPAINDAAKTALTALIAQLPAIIAALNPPGPQ